MTVSPDSEASTDGEIELERLMTLGYDRTTATTMLQAAGGSTDSESAETSRRMEPGERFAAMFGGTFLFFFGLPFTLVPVMMWGTILGVGSTGMEDEPIGFLIALCFPIPFAMAGLAVQFFGVKAFRVGLKGETEEDGSGLQFSYGSGHGAPPTATSDAFSQSSFPSMAEVQQAQPGSPVAAPQVASDIAGNGRELESETPHTATRASSDAAQISATPDLRESNSNQPPALSGGSDAESGSFWDLKPVDEG